MSHNGLQQLSELTNVNPGGADSFADFPVKWAIYSKDISRLWKFAEWPF
jgi:hypothetical protein